MFIFYSIIIVENFACTYVWYNSGESVQQFQVNTEFLNFYIQISDRECSFAVVGPWNRLSIRILPGCINPLIFRDIDKFLVVASEDVFNKSVG